MRVLRGTALRDSLTRADFQSKVTPERRAALDRLFTTEVLNHGFAQASLLDPQRHDHLQHRPPPDREPRRPARARPRGARRHRPRRRHLAPRRRRAAEGAPHVRAGRGAGRHRRRRRLPGLRTDRERRQRRLRPGRRHLRGRARAALRRARADPAPCDPADPTPDGRDRASRALRRTHRAAEPDALSVARRQRPGENPAATVLLLDLDRFKEVNDALGHERATDCCRSSAHGCATPARTCGRTARRRRVRDPAAGAG